jgi:hypothetical protein
VAGDATATTHTGTGLTNGTAYTFEVRAVNGAGDGVASNKATAIPNTAPTVTTQADPSFAENGTGIVATYVATDADNTNFTWRLTAADSALLSISASGDLSFNAAPDFENPVDSGGDNTYNVNVIATDDAPAPLASAEYPVAITVTNVDEDGVVTLAPATVPKVGVEITATLSDPDGGVTVGSWKWESTPDGTVAWADISGAAAYTPVSGDTGNQLRAMVSYEDAEAASKTAMSAATVGTPFSYQFGAVTDPNGHTVTYSAILDDDSALPPWLRFNNATRTFSSTAQAGNEGAITVKVTVTDDGTPPKSTPGTFTITVGAAADCTALAIDQDDSTGFGDNLTVRLYASAGDAEVACTDAGRSGWEEIGTDNANDRGGFSIPIVVDDSEFDSAGAYQVCAVDGGGTRNEMPVSMSVKFGIQVAGDGAQDFTPGEDVHITLIGGGSISAADSEWDLRGDDLVVTLPPGESGNVQISVFVNQGQPGAQRANANITVGSLELEVTGLRPAGLILGQSFLVQVDGLAGTEVRSVRLDDIELAFLQGGDIYRSGEYPPVPGNGRFTGSVVAINRDGSLSDQLIRMALDSDGTEELEIEDSAGVVASAEVNVAIPTITIDPAEGSVSRGGEITITGQNFPIYHDDYNREEIEVFVNDRREARIESSNGSWTQKVTIRRSMDSGTRLNIDVRIGDYSFRNLTRGLELRVTPAELAVIPKELKIGNPFRYTVTGLEGFVRYAIKIDDRLEVVEFTTDDAGNQTGITVIPVNYHRTFATSSGQPATLQVNDSQGARVAGVFFTVILQPSALYNQAA